MVCALCVFLVLVLLLRVVFVCSRVCAVVLCFVCGVVSWVVYCGCGCVVWVVSSYVGCCCMFCFVVSVRPCAISMLCVCVCVCVCFFVWVSCACCCCVGACFACLRM